MMGRLVSAKLEWKWKEAVSALFNTEICLFELRETGKTVIRAGLRVEM
jgi:hypothetical protein